MGSSLWNQIINIFMLKCLPRSTLGIPKNSVQLSIVVLLRIERLHNVTYECLKENVLQNIENLH